MQAIGRRTAGATSLVAAIGLLLASPAIAASEWDIDSATGADSSISLFGVPNTATYGQTITVPVGPASLESFSFAVTLPASLVFRGAVQAWDDTAGRATGEVLYLSPPTSTAGTGLETVTFTPKIALAPGTYVLYTTVSYDYETQVGAVGTWAAWNTDHYPGGQFVFMNNGTDESLLTVNAWSRFTAQDAAFTVTFAAPAPPATPVITPPRFTG